MIQNVLLGTLSTLNTLISPLGPGSPNDQLNYTFFVKPNPGIEKLCHQGPSSPQVGQPQPQLSMQIERFEGSHLSAKLRTSLCQNGTNTKTSLVDEYEVQIHLPLQILDSDLINRLPLNQGYVISGIPSVDDPNRKVRVKLTKLTPSIDRSNGEKQRGQPVKVEWIPDSAIDQETPPITIWIATSELEFKNVKGYRSSSVPWIRIATSLLPKIKTGPIANGEFQGEFRKISLGPKDKQQIEPLHALRSNTENSIDIDGQLTQMSEVRNKSE